MTTRKRFELETLGEGKCHILRVGGDYVVFTDGERRELIEMLEGVGKVAVLDRHVNGKSEGAPKERVRQRHAASGRRR